MPVRHIISDEVRVMANRYSKNNNSSKRIEEKSMQKYQDQIEKLNTGAKIMALLVALAMIVTTFLASGVFFFD